MATLFIHNLAVRCRLGIYPREQRHPQTIWIDAELRLRHGRATVDYAVLLQRIRMLCRAKSYGLMETLAGTLARALLAYRPVTRVTLRVKKRALPGLDYAGVEVSRLRRPPA